MKLRKIAAFYPATHEQVGNMNIRRALPVAGLKEVSPFLLIDHMGPKMLAAGGHFEVPPHPHAGFQTVTYFLEGSGFHKDSLGNEQTIHAGDVNWMTAGRGIVHGEYGDPVFEKKGGKLEGFQIWVNLPDKFRDTEPDFGNYSSSQLPEIDGDNWWLKIIAGEFQNEKSPVKMFSEVFLFHLKMEPNAQIEIPVKENHNAILYQAAGETFVNEKTNLEESYLCEFRKDGDGILLENRTEKTVQTLVMGGEPLNEKYMSYGPFIARNLEHLQEQIRRYEKGELGEVH